MALGAGEDFFFFLLLFPVGEGEDGEDAADGARVDDAADDGRDDEGVFTAVGMRITTTKVMLRSCFVCPPLLANEIK